MFKNLCLIAQLNSSKKLLSASKTCSEWEHPFHNIRSSCRFAERSLFGQVITRTGHYVPKGTNLSPQNYKLMCNSEHSYTRRYRNYTILPSPSFPCSVICYVFFAYNIRDIFCRFFTPPIIRN